MKQSKGLNSNDQYNNPKKLKCPFLYPQKLFNYKVSDLFLFAHLELSNNPRNKYCHLFQDKKHQYLDGKPMIHIYIFNE